MKGNILVTGGSGFIGSHLVNSLTGMTPNKVVVYDINAQCSQHRNLVTMQGDIFDTDRLAKVLRDTEISSVIHMVGLASIPDCRANPTRSFQLNVASVQNVLEAMRLCDAERLVFPSTAAVYGATNGPQVREEVTPRPSNVYGCHKLAAELLIRGYADTYGVKPTILRIFNVYGDLNKEQGVISLFLRRALAGKPLIIKGGDQLRDFVFLHDVVEAFIRSLNSAASHGKTINVGSGVGLSIKDIAKMIQQSVSTVQIGYEPPDRKEYSIYADTARMKRILRGSTTDPRVGIPEFIEACKNTRTIRSSLQ